MDRHQIHITKTAQETAALGEALGHTLTAGEGDKIGKPRVYCLYGDLGSGKTTFVQGFAKGLGINNRLLSPTFIIVRHYHVPESNRILHHVDLYRLHTQGEVQQMGLSELLSDPHAVVMIEWPQRMNGVPADSVSIRFSVETDGDHRIEIS